MGWSCRADAGDTDRRISDACVAQTGSSNGYEANGERFFYENSRREYADGRITGTIFRLEEVEGREVAYRTAGYTISPDGDVTRGPPEFRALAASPL